MNEDDTRALIEYYRQLQERHRDRLVPPSVPRSDAEGGDAA